MIVDEMITVTRGMNKNDKSFFDFLASRFLDLPFNSEYILVHILVLVVKKFRKCLALIWAEKKFL